MRVVHALYDSRADASRAVRALEAHGIKSESISLISTADERPDPVAEGAEIGTDLGAIAGAAGGLLAGLGIVTIPGVGPVLGGGWLVSAALGFVAGAAAGMTLGGIAGALINEGIPEEHAKVYEEAIRRGGALVTAWVREEDMLVAEHALDEAPRVDLAALRAGYAIGQTPDGGGNFTT